MVSENHPNRPRPHVLTLLISSVLPGVLAGTQLAGLLFFINPHLPFDWPTALRGIASYGAILGGVSALFLFPVYWRWPERAKRWLPALLTAVLAISGLLAWLHAFHFSFFF